MLSRSGEQVDACVRDHGGGQGQAHFGAAAGNTHTSSEDVRQREETDDKSGNSTFSQRLCDSSKESRLTVSSKRENVVCHKCKKAGHYARECPGEAKSDVNTEPDKESTVKVDSKPRLRRDTAKHLTCYHCHKKGHNCDGVSR